MSDGAAAFRKLDELPRARLAHLPTPIEAMPNLAAALGGDIRLYVKRDDCTGLAFGDNKIRQLEFYMGEDEAADTDTILITGAVQSNFVRAAVTAARKLGMDCHIQLEERVPRNDVTYHQSGNVLIDKLLGATLYSYPEGEDETGADARIGEIAAGLKPPLRHPPDAGTRPPRGAGLCRRRPRAGCPDGGKRPGVGRNRRRLGQWPYPRRPVVRPPGVGLHGAGDRGLRAPRRSSSASRPGAARSPQCSGSSRWSITATST